MRAQGTPCRGDRGRGHVPFPGFPARAPREGSEAFQPARRSATEPPRPRTRLLGRPRARGTKARPHPCPGPGSGRRSQPRACDARLSAWRPRRAPLTQAWDERGALQLGSPRAGRGAAGGGALATRGERRRSRRAADPREGTVQALPSIVSQESPF